jgi:hypothetical protein
MATTVASGGEMGLTRTILAIAAGAVGASLVAWGLLQTSRPIDEVAQADAARLRELFIKKYACPVNGKHTEACPGWVVNYVKPLCAGGADRLSNLQWQTVATAKRKEREAQKLCAKPKR